MQNLSSVNGDFYIQDNDSLTSLTFAPAPMMDAGVPDAGGVELIDVSGELNILLNNNLGCAAIGDLVSRCDVTGAITVVNNQQATCP